MKHTLALSLLLAAGSEAAAVAPRDTGCSDVHIFLAKGNNEPYPGRQGKLVNAICNGLSSCDYEDIKFYNPGNSNYCTSVSEGSANGVSQIEAYNKKCPNAKLVVSGYSQGGDVVGNVLGGGGGTVFGCQVTADTSISASSAAGKKIVAGLFFGDVRHTGGQSYNVLDGAPNDGVAPRSGQALKNLDSYGAALRSYCAAADPICAKGNVVADHLNYFDLYTDAAAAWVQERIKAADGTSASSSSGSSGASKTAAASHVVTAAPTKGWSNSTGSVTVPAYGNDIDTLTYKPITDITTVTEVMTVTSDCPSKGLVYTQTKTVTVECPICQYVSSYTKTASSPPSQQTGGNGGSPSKTVPAASATITAPVGGGSYSPGNGTVTGGGYSPSKPTPGVPQVGVSAASAQLPRLGGLLVAVAALLAL